MLVPQTGFGNQTSSQQLLLQTSLKILRWVFSLFSFWNQFGVPHYFYGMTFLLVLLPFAGAADGARVFTAPCDAKDPAQQWTFDASAGQLSINQQCATLFGGTPSSDATIVLAPCASSDWRLQTPAHPVAAGSTWLVSTQSPQGLSWFIPIPQSNLPPPPPTPPPPFVTCPLSPPIRSIHANQLT